MKKPLHSNLVISAVLALLLLVGHAISAPTIAPVTSVLSISWDSNTPVANGTTPLLLPPWVSGKIIACSYYTGGASSPSFTASVKIGATAVTGCSSLNVSSSTPTTAAATANNAFGPTSSLSLVISGVSGSPTTALIQINIQTTAN